MSIKSKLRHRYFFFIACFLIFVIGMIGMVINKKIAKNQASDVGLTLLIPEPASLQHPVTLAWLTTAKEAGVLLNTMTDDEFLRARANGTTMAGVVLPDYVHQQASDLLITHLYRYVREGGYLLVSFDAATLQQGRATYPKQASRLSELVGVEYAMYNTLGDDTTAQGIVYANRDAETQLAIQPGKLDFGKQEGLPWGALTTYAYQQLNYSYYRTRNSESIIPLIKSQQQDAVVSTNTYGSGQVLFANLPLGYLKTRTDGYLLHKILTYFATNMLKQPLLAASPNAVGGIVLSSEAALETEERYRTQKGSSAYYTTADSGLGPTHSYSSGQPAQGKDIWAFPISHYKHSASLNEIFKQGVSQTAMCGFITAFLSHVSENHIVRTLNFQPGVEERDAQTMDLLTAQASKLQDTGRFNWYRMADLAEFMTQRERTRWEITQDSVNDNRQLTAHNDTTLQSQTWLFNKAHTQKLKVTQGKALISEVGEKWLVKAGDSKVLVIEWQQAKKS